MQLLPLTKSLLWLTQDGRKGRRRRVVAALAALAGLAILPYVPALRLPFIADDYVQIRLARDYGPVSGWPALAADPLYRCRATSLVLTYWTERLFGLDPLGYNWSSLLLHVVNTFLVFALGAWRVVGWRISTVAAAFFAVYEGHQEAVIWYAALPELLVFFFSLLTLLFWILWLHRPTVPLHYAAALSCFLLALASKESAVAVVPLLALALGSQWQDRKRLLALVPFAALAVLYAGMIFSARAVHLHFNDAGTFSLSAPFLLTWSKSIGRLLWIWGLLSVAVLAARAGRRRHLLVLAFAWIGITLLPYSFLTYMTRVPSRHTYFASAGLGMVVAAGWLEFRRLWGRSRPWATGALAALIVVHNCAYLWTRKQAQYLERAAPTEALIQVARRVTGPIYVHCFPYDRSVAALAVEFGAQRSAESLIWDPARGGAIPISAVFCWNPTHAARPTSVLVGQAR